MPDAPAYTPLSSTLVSALVERIDAGVYAVGDRLPSEQTLEKEFGVSRTVVREALSTLRAQGLVTTGQGRRASVVRRDVPDAFRIEAAGHTLLQEVISVLELRIALESEAAVLAAQRRSDDDLAVMRASIAAMARAIAAGEDATTPDIQFHRHIAAATGNAHFLRLLDYLGENGIPRSRLPSVQPTAEARRRYLDTIRREHEQICYAVERSDPDAARAAMRLHLIGSRDRLLKTANARALA